MSPVSNTHRPEVSLVGTRSLWRSHHRASPCTVAMNASIVGVYDVHVFRGSGKAVDLDLLSRWGDINAAVNLIGDSNRARVRATTESNHGTIMLAVTSRESPISVSVTSRHGGLKIRLPRDFDGVIDVSNRWTTVPPNFDGDLSETTVQMPYRKESSKPHFLYRIEPRNHLTATPRPYYKRDRVRIRTLSGKVSISYAYPH